MLPRDVTALQPEVHVARLHLGRNEPRELTDDPLEELESARRRVLVAVARHIRMGLAQQLPGGEQLACFARETVVEHPPGPLGQ
jgi:hypothetical protein